MGDEFLREPVQIPMAVEKAPVEPADLVVLAICVVVAALRSAHFVAHLEHRGTDRNQQNDKEVLDLASAKSLVAASSVGPSIPQFQDKLLSDPSRLSSPFVSLCL